MSYICLYCKFEPSQLQVFDLHQLIRNEKFGFVMISEKFPEGVKPASPRKTMRVKLLRNNLISKMLMYY